MWPAVLHLISGLMMEMPGTKLMVVTGDSIGLVGVTECVGGGGGMSVISLCTWKIKKTCDTVTVSETERQTKGPGTVYQYFTIGPDYS